MSYFVGLSIMVSLLKDVLIARIKQQWQRRQSEPTTQILPPIELPSILPPDEVAIPSSSADSANRPVDDNLTVILACARPSLSLASMRWCRCPDCHSILFTKRQYCELDSAAFEEIPECILDQLARDRSILAHRLEVHHDSQVIALLLLRHRYQQESNWSQDGRCEVVE